jgi:hypothetical protein
LLAQFFGHVAQACQIVITWTKDFGTSKIITFALNQMQYDASNGEGLPRLSDPLTAPVFEKLVDFENVSVILADDRLGFGS